MPAIVVCSIVLSAITTVVFGTYEGEFLEGSTFMNKIDAWINKPESDFKGNARAALFISLAFIIFTAITQLPLWAFGLSWIFFGVIPTLLAVFGLFLGFCIWAVVDTTKKEEVVEDVES